MSFVRFMPSVLALQFACIGTLVAGGVARANPVLDTSASDAQVEAVLEGPGIDIADGSLTVITGQGVQYGTFSNGDQASGAGPVIGIDSGIMLVTGDADAVLGSPQNAVLGPNDTTQISSRLNTSFSDPQLTSVDSSATNDPIVLTLEVTPSKSILKFSFVFASDEYPEYVGTRFNDAFGFFIKPVGSSTWQNVALVPGTSTPIAVNTINNGSPGAFAGDFPATGTVDYTNSGLHVENGEGATPNDNANLQYDGLTIPLVVETAVTPGQAYDVKLAIADSGDSGLDSAVFVKWISSSDFAADADLELDLTVDNDAPASGDAVTFTLTATNAGQDAVSGVEVDFDLPAGFTHTGNSASGAYDPSSGLWTVPGTLGASGGTQSITINATAGGSGGAIDAYAQVTAMAANDLDSEPGNGTAPTAAEDDEAVVAMTVTPPIQSCVAIDGSTVGSATLVSGNEYQLTPATNDQIGAIWSNQNINLQQPFDYNARVYLGNVDANGADGIAFVLHTQGTNALGQPGSGIGAGDSETGSGISPSLTIELDTFRNTGSGWNDPADDHIAVYLNGNTRHDGAATDLAGPVALANLEDDAYHDFRVTWVPATNTLETYVDGILRTTTVVDIADELGTSSVYWGYTASTGGFNNRHAICNLNDPSSASDLSDAPVAGTSYGEVTHGVVAGLSLGTANDTDFGSLASPNADGDGAEDDGVTMPELGHGANVTIPVSVTQASGNSGFLQGWIDWNGDGTFGAGEQIATDLQSANAGTSTIAIPVSVPLTAVTTQTFARFRWSTTAALDATAAATDGEVEDYAVTVQPIPAASTGTANYPTSGNGQYPGSIALLDWAGSGLDDGIRHGDEVSFSLPGCRAGTLTATFRNVSNAANATGYRPTDAQTWSGASFHTAYNGPGTGEAIYGQSGNLDIGFTIDWSMTVNGVTRTPDIFFTDAEATSNGAESISATTNGGAWTVADEAGGSDYIVSGIGTQSVTFSKTYQPNNSPLLLSMNMTRTDITIASGGMQGIAFGLLLPCDYGDASGYGNPTHAFDQVPASPMGLEAATGILYLGSTPPDSEVGTQATGDASGDDGDLLGDDEDGITFPALIRGQTVTLTAAVSGAGGYLQGWIDWSGNGVFDEPVEQIATDLQDTDGDGFISIPVTVPTFATGAQTVARFRWSSDFGTGSDGAAPDGEVEDYPVTVGNGSGPQLSGTLILDNGTGGGTPHDARISGGESGTPLGTVTLLDGAGMTIATVPVGGDGTWSYALPAGFGGPVTVTTAPQPGYRPISERTDGLPALTNIDAHDGSFTFTPVAGQSYTALDVGLIQTPTLRQDQSAGILPGQIVALPHRYTATTSGAVTFALTDAVSNPAGAFASAIFADADCDGVADATISGAIAVAAGQSICLVVRTQASAGIGQSAAYSYTLTATTAYSGTALSDTASNADRLGSGGTENLVLRKLVSNVTRGGGEVTSSQGEIGDVLRYRIILSNPGTQPVTQVVVSDETPAYTALSAPVPTPVTVASGVDCSLATPASNVAGYAGPLRWSCSGAMQPGSQGSVTFDVRISP